VIEHLVFTGTKSRSHEDISREIEKKGGVLNAFTSQDVTAFWFKLPSEHLFVGLDILSDLLLNPTFEPVKFEKEKKVIIEEIRMYHDMPMRHVFDAIEANLYGAPFGESVIGSEKTVSALSRDFVADFFAKHYNPRNYIVTIVGDADFSKVCEYCESHFVASDFSFKLPKITKINRDSVEERSGIDQAHFVFAFHAPLSVDKDYFALEVLDAYLANGMSSRLFLEIREKRGLAYSVRGGINTEKNYSYYTIYAGTTKPAVPEVKKIILQELEKVKDLSSSDLAEAKERVIGLRKVSSEESVSVMNELLFAELAHEAQDYYEHEANIRAVTLDQVKKLARVKKFSTAAIVPK